jgi:galactokinase
MEPTDTVNVTLSELNGLFLKEFGTDAEVHFFQAPARVNIIGEHTDYNNGYVLPLAIDRSIMAAAAKREDRMLQLRSLNFSGKMTSSLEGLTFDKSKDWANFPLGVAWVLQKNGMNLTGADILFSGNIPLGGGLSSSAAIEVLMMRAMLDLSGCSVKDEEIPLLCRKVENEFIGVQSGVMDQFIITMGKENCAIFLDCGTMDYRYVPFRNAENTAIIVGNTKVKRELAHSAYNQRVRECGEAVDHFRKLLNRPEIQSLSDISLEEFGHYRDQLPELQAKRAEHVIHENGRVKEAVSALENGDMDTLGNLLLKSHNSLKNLYEVSCGELDHMVESFMLTGAAYGARMTGAGFGGSAIAIVPQEAKDEVIETAEKEYKKRTGIDGEFYACRIAGGARKL